MRIAVTGSDGFTGRYVADALAGRGHEALPVLSDITDSGQLAEEIASLRPDGCIHLAAIAFVAETDFRPFYHVNQIGTFNLLTVLAETAPGIAVLLPSSAQVYGADAQGTIGEDAATDPHNHYALSKIAMEQGAQFWADRLKLIVTRPFNYTGVRQEERFLIPKIIAHFARRAPLIELGNLHVRRDFGDVRSVAEAYVALIERGEACGPLNVSSGTPHSIGDILGIAERLSGHRMEVEVNPAFVRGNDPALLLGDNARLREKLPGWAPRALEDTLGWMLEHAA